MTTNVLPPKLEVFGKLNISKQEVNNKTVVQRETDMNSLHRKWPG